MKLYGSLTSPYVRKARILLDEKAVACEFVVEDPWDAKTAIARLNPLGKVPVLELDSGEALFDSAVILEYLDCLQGEPLIPTAGDARWQVQRWHALADGILDAVVTRLWEMRRREEQQSEEIIERQELKIARALAHAESAIRHQSYLVGERFSLADLALGVALEYVDFRYPNDWRVEAPRLAFWVAGIRTRPAFAKTAPPGMEPLRNASH